jgi:hypothetical protein
VTEPFRARKQPVEVEVIRHDGTFQCAEAIALWVFSNGRTSRVVWEAEVPFITIDLPDRTLRVSPADYVIKGGSHEFAVVGPEEFAVVYEVLNE